MKTISETNNKIWIKCYINGALSDVVTFAEIKNKIIKRKEFFSQKEIKEGDRVIVKMNNSIESIVNYLTLSEMGIISVPINPKDSKTRIDFITNDCNPRAIIEEDNSLLILQNATNDNNHGKINTIIYTSGTTGTPKGVCLSLDNWENNARSLIDHHKLNDKTILATPLPLFHCNCHGLGMYATYYSRSTLILFDKVPDNFLEIINEEKVNIVSVVPVILRKLFDSNKNFRAHDELKYFLTAAAPLSSDLLYNITNGWKVRIIQGYGLTESTNFSCTVPVDLSDDIYKKVMFPCPSIGVELDGVEISIEKQDGSGSGELVIKSDSNFLGYWKRDVSGIKIVDTGDIGYIKIVSGRRYFYLKGRKKELINRGGEKIYPLELESEIKDLGLDIDFHVVSIKDSYFGEEVGLVVLKNGNFSLLKNIPYFRRPKKIFKVNTFLRTSTGKIKRKEMSEICEEGKSEIIWENDK